MRKTILATALALATAGFNLQSVAAPADLVYACSMGNRDAMSLNLTRHQFHFVDHVGLLNEGDISFNFRTKAGYLVTMDLGDPDRLHFGKPRVVKGWGSVGGPGGSQGRMEKVTCVRTR